MDGEQHRQLVVNVYAGVELLTLAVLHFIVWQRLRLSLLMQLAFVFESQWRTVQAKMVLWVVYVVQGTLVHSGADYTFRFAWLHDSP